MSTAMIFGTSVVLTLLAAGTAAWLSAWPGARGATRKAVADRLAHIALLGAAAIFSLLAHGVD